MSEWKQGLCNCCGDCELCCCGTFCYPCLIRRNANDLNKPGLLCCLIGCFFPCLPIFILSGEAREKYGIEGSTMGDAGAAFCCDCCANIQTGVEIKERGDHH